MFREAHGEVLTGETSRPAIEPRNHNSGVPMLLSEAEGNTRHDVNACHVETLRGRRTCACWEVSCTEAGRSRPYPRPMGLGWGRQGRKPYSCHPRGREVGCAHKT